MCNLRLTKGESHLLAERATLLLPAALRVVQPMPSLLAALRIRNRLAVRLILRPPAVLPTRSPHVERLIQLPLAALLAAQLTLSR